MIILDYFLRYFVWKKRCVWAIPDWKSRFMLQFCQETCFKGSKLKNSCNFMFIPASGRRVFIHLNIAHLKKQMSPHSCCHQYPLWCVCKQGIQKSHGWSDLSPFKIVITLFIPTSWHLERDCLSPDSCIDPENDPFTIIPHTSKESSPQDRGKISLLSSIPTNAN